jgi:methylthioribose-1-phosphate isomerase
MRTIEWAGGAVRLIDQRCLPQQLKTETIDDVHGLARAIREMHIRGAPAIGAAAAFGMALAAKNSSARTPAELQADLERAAVRLRATRPTAANLFWAVERMLDCAQESISGGARTDSVVDLLTAEAQAIADEDVAINRRLGAHGAEVVPQGGRLLTHCNAGALATVDYGTALGVVRAAHTQEKAIRVYVDETRPRLQGARLTAWEL